LETTFRDPGSFNRAYVHQKTMERSDGQQNAFDTMRRIMARKTIMAYPNLEIFFEVHTDASPYQLGAVISQKGKSIAFY
jgi:hypothetical protein